MAKDKTKSGGASTPYIVAAILVAVMYVINATLVNRIYMNNRKMSQETSNTMSAINRINSQISEINGDVLSIIANVGNATAHANSATAHFEVIHEAAEDFRKFDVSDSAKRRFEHAMVVVDTYEARLTQFREMWNQATEQGGTLGTDAFGGDMEALYTQDIYPLQVTASQMLISTIDIVNIDTAKKSAANAKQSYFLMFLMLAVFILSEIAVFVVAKLAKKQRLELEERERNLAEVDAKLTTSRQNVNELALSNILTGMKNRYALDNDISERLDTDRFVIAVFDMDNFRMINDNYGYDFGDEYLTIIADKLREDFGRFAEIYNITGNEFCFVFNREISESQAIGISQTILACMTSPFVVLNLSVQLTATGAMHTYLPGDCSNLNQLLVKLDTAMREAKRNGGNMLVQTNKI